VAVPDESRNCGETMLVVDEEATVLFDSGSDVSRVGLGRPSIWKQLGGLIIAPFSCAVGAGSFTTGSR
jgi:hypothetical protein